MLAFSVIFFISPSFALDTDLYAVTGEEVPPNVLVILDNSSSMTNQDQVPDYNPNSPAFPPDYDGPYAKDGVYSKQGNDWILWKSTTSDISCESAKNSLRKDGLFNGKMKTDTTCGGNKSMFLQTGNYMNYLVWTTTSNQPRLGLATGTLHSYVNSTEGIRFGLMVFNANGQGGSVTAPVSDDKNTFFKALSEINTSSVVDWTPLAESLYESMLYFKGERYYHSGNSYESPIQYYCQKNYVILITDGAPTYDVADDLNSPVSSIVGDFDQDGKEPGSYGDPDMKGSHYLDDVAKYVHNTDLRADLKGLQNITVYTIGFNPTFFAIDSTLLQSAAQKGGGKYFYCHNAQSFKIAFQLIIEEILNKSTSFLAPTVPISQLEKTTSGDRMYLGMFKPTEKSFWKGNIKKFGIATKDAGTIKLGDILDKNGKLAIDPEINSIYDKATSYWSTSEDGGEVEKGGVGKILYDTMPDTYDPATVFNYRKIYTYLGSNFNLTDTSNQFTTANIVPSTLELSSEEERNKLISFLYGYDAYDENGNMNTTEKRDWILGAFVHSRPLILHYTDRSVIYAGANDGMLHAFDAESGQELWAFIPPDLLPKLQNLSGNTVEFFVDGSPKAYIGTDKRILVCGERRGGTHYFALDVTNPLNPVWIWEINPDPLDSPFHGMGQSWSSPLMGKIKYGAGDKWVIFIGGGYDNTRQDSLPVSNPTNGDTHGKGIYVVDVLTGNLIWKYTQTNNAQMKYSIPSDIARIDTYGAGRVDRLYMGDMGGQLWRFDIGDPDPANWTAKRIFNANDPLPSAGVDMRKIFYPPDVSLEKDNYGNYELLLFGTGDREHPKNTAVADRLYTLKDRNSGSVLKESNLVDVTEDLLQSSSTSAEEKQSILDNLKTASGWYIRLNPNSGEKCLAPPLVFYGVSYFSTFTPLIGSVSDPCFVGEGTATLYALNYLNGNAVFNFDLTNDGETSPTLLKSDRTLVIGTAIPSGAIITIIGGSTASGYIGVGGGIFKAPLKNTNVIIPINWRQKF